ncbi:MAG: hypothetical protein ROO71_08825 [Balneola sp.]
MDIDLENKIIKLDISIPFKELTNEAFDFYFKRRLFYFLSITENQLGDLSIFEEFKIEFGEDVYDQFKKGLKEYLAIKKEIKTHYPGESINDMMHTQLIDLSELIPPTKKMHRKIINLIYVNKLSAGDFIHWLKGQDLDFYKDKQTELYAFSIFTGLRNSKNLYRGLGINCFHYTYSGVRKSDIPSFSKKLLNKTFHLNDILDIKNNTLNPVCFFGEGLGGYYNWEADPLYS